MTPVILRGGRRCATWDDRKKSEAEQPAMRLRTERRCPRLVTPVPGTPASGPYIRWARQRRPLYVLPPTPGSAATTRTLGYCGTQGSCDVCATPIHAPRGSVLPGRLGTGRPTS